MKELAISKARRYLRALKNSHNKFETRDSLSATLGFYPEIIAADLAQFEPMIMIDYDYDLLRLVPDLENYIAQATKAKTKTIVKNRVTHKEIDTYSEIGEFIYEKMTIGASGIVNKNAHLSDRDLQILRKLVLREIKGRRNQK